MPELTRRSLLTTGGALAGAGLLAPERAWGSLPDDSPVRTLDEAMPGAFSLERSLLDATAFERLPLRPAGWHPAKLHTQNLATALWTGHYHGTTPRERRTEEFASQFRARAGGMSDSVLASARALEDLGPEGLARFDALVAENPEVLGDVRERMMHELLVGGAPEHLERRYDRVHRQVAWRLQHQGAAAIVGDHIDRLDRIANKHGALDWRERAYQARNAPFYREGELSAEQYREKSRRSGKIGIILLSSSLGTFAVGGLLSAATANPFPFIFAATPGVILLITASVFLLVSASQAGKARRMGG